MPNETPEPLNIVLYPDPFLTKPCRAITAEELAAGKADGWDLNELSARMVATMYKNEGIGLAGPQVGVGLKIFVVDISKERNRPFTIINPAFSELHGTITEEEGCLSIPDVRAKVKRYASLKVTGLDLKGQKLEFETGEDVLLARVCQHENDHLNGVLFINKIGMAAKLLVRRRLIELEEDYELAQAKKKRQK
jgi:peptide deformylase